MAQLWLTSVLCRTAAFFAFIATALERTGFEGFKQKMKVWVLLVLVRVCAARQIVIGGGVSIRFINQSMNVTTVAIHREFIEYLQHGFPAAVK
jgi:hypothetical protein